MYVKVLNFLNNFILNTINLNFFILVNRVLKWLMVKALCASMRSWVQFWMDVCIPCTNAVYKRVHHNELHGNLFIDKIEKKEL